MGIDVEILISCPLDVFPDVGLLNHILVIF